jgi:hypothetical protein
MTHQCDEMPEDWYVIDIDKRTSKWRMYPICDSSLGAMIDYCPFCGQKLGD